MSEEPNVLNIKKMIDYQEGSIVSRTLIDKPTGTVTLFAFSAGQALSEHTAPFDALVHIVDGSAEIMISGKKYHMKAGEMITMPANAPHALNANEQFKMILIMIRE